MVVERLINRVYELDKAIHPSDELKQYKYVYKDKRAAERTVKRLNQFQRQLLISILQGNAPEKNLSAFEKKMREDFPKEMANTSASDWKKMQVEVMLGRLTQPAPPSNLV